jgi:hypothetical protein
MAKKCPDCGGTTWVALGEFPSAAQCPTCGFTYNPYYMGTRRKKKRNTVTEVIGWMAVMIIWILIVFICLSMTTIAIR